MKILKPGKIKTTKWIGECGFCGAIAEYDRRDLYESNVLSEDSALLWIDCPECFCHNSMCLSPVDDDRGQNIMASVQNSAE